MSGLIIGTAQRVKIAELRAFAAATVLDPSASGAAAAADIEAYRDMMGTLSIKLPVGFLVTYSHERQPFGLARHLSVSVDRPHRMPSESAVEMILAAFSMKPARESVAVWLEDVDLTTKAINIVQPLETANV